MTVLQDKQVKIRKRHFCTGCRKTFKAGCLLRYTVYTDMRELCTVYTCQKCDHYSLQNNIDEYYEGDIGDYRREGVFAYIEARKRRKVKDTHP